nr:non-homologous end-joining DNA ligase [Actinospica robiniae]
MNGNPGETLDEVVARQSALLRPASENPGSAMLATLSARREFGSGWILERKLDGIRAIAIRTGDRVRLLSRTGKPLDAAFPELAEALAAQPCADFAVDGEICALDHGATDFGLLQQRIGLSDPAVARRSRVKVTYFLFDLLRLDANDTTRLPLLTRKALLHEALHFAAPLRYTAHQRAAEDVHGAVERACSRGWEGLIAKRADGPYAHRRSPDWLKLKCAKAQEFVVGGFTEPAGSRVGFGALLLGYYDGEDLRFAGKVGTGWDVKTLHALRTRLDGLQQRASPFADDVRERGVVHWIRPEFVAQIGFGEWTRDGMLRHPRYLGAREDKRARDVVREVPAA